MKKLISLSPTAMFVLCATLSLGAVTACSDQTASTPPTTAPTTVATPASTAAKPAMASNAMGTNAASSKDASDPTSTALFDQSTGKGATPSERSQRREALLKKVKAILTPEQVTQLDSKLAQHEKMGKALSEINLTPEEKTQLHEIAKTMYHKGKKGTEQKSQ